MVLVSLLLNNPIVFIFGQIFIAVGITTVITGSTTFLSLVASQKSFATTFGAMTSFFFLGSSIGPGIANELYQINPSWPYAVITLIVIVIVPIMVFIFRSSPKKGILQPSMIQ